MKRSYSTKVKETKVEFKIWDGTKVVTSERVIKGILYDDDIRKALADVDYINNSFVKKFTDMEYKYTTSELKEIIIASFMLSNTEIKDRARFKLPTPFIYKRDVNEYGLPTILFSDTLQDGFQTLYEIELPKETVELFKAAHEVKIVKGDNKDE